jgi:hypothetical protein
MCRDVIDALRANVDGPAVLHALQFLATADQHAVSPLSGLRGPE